MKVNYWLVLGALISTSLLAQQTTNAPASPTIETPAAAPAVTNAPAAKPEKKPSSKKKAATQAKAAKKKDPAAELTSVPLTAGQAVVVASNVNVRGQAKLKSEVVAHLTKGQTVAVLEEIILKNSGPDEPSAWAKIILPAKTPVWVHASYIDPTNQTVLPKQLKLRGGPGENYSVLGMLKRGDEVKQIGTKDNWIKIEAPAEACAFVAAQYLKQEAPGAAVATIAEPTPTPAKVNEAPPIAATTTDAPIPPPPDASTASATTTNTSPDSVAAEPAPVEPPPKRIVQREGLVRGTFSIQAPTRFELISPDNGKAMNYLYTTSSSLDLQRYKGLRIIVTGEEGLDERWRNTPVITIQKIQVVE